MHEARATLSQIERQEAIRKMKNGGRGAVEFPEGERTGRFIYSAPRVSRELLPSLSWPPT